MSLTVLYVYTPTSFDLSSPAETLGGATVPAGLVTLVPGVYRLSGTARPTASFVAADFEVASLGSKFPYPDPPLRALTELVSSKQELESFLIGAGKIQAVG